MVGTSKDALVSPNWNVSEIKNPVGLISVPFKLWQPGQNRPRRTVVGGIHHEKRRPLQRRHSEKLAALVQRHLLSL